MRNERFPPKSRKIKPDFVFLITVVVWLVWSFDVDINVVGLFV